MHKYLKYFLCPYWLRVEKVLLAAIRLINLKSKKVGEDTNCSDFIIQFEFCRINRVVSILPLPGLFSCKRDGRGFHYFSKLYGLFMAKAREILIALSLATEEGCYHDLSPDDYNARFLSYRRELELYHMLKYLPFGEDDFRDMNIFSFVRLSMNVVFHWCADPS
ncbi:hypothetical protein Tco_1111475 [Tanacetum coccineum]|uniref:Uncharacterized protein n=1 Tax=Tanacetum coccineum TaxID=301880 RepID=A0ABQ5ILU0_9ASTR